MIVFLYILAILLTWMIGTASFSFVNVIAYRYPKQKKINDFMMICNYSYFHAAAWFLLSNNVDI